MLGIVKVKNSDIIKGNYNKVNNNFSSNSKNIKSSFDDKVESLDVNKTGPQALNADLGHDELMGIKERDKSPKNFEFFDFDNVKNHNSFVNINKTNNSEVYDREYIGKIFADSENIQKLVGTMSEEEYSNFIIGVEKYYDKQIEILDDMLKGSDDEKLDEEGIAQIKQYLESAENKKKSAKYDYLFFMKDYYEYTSIKPTKDDYDKLLEDSNVVLGNKDNYVSFQTVDNNKYFSYDAYHEKHPNVSPTEYITMLEEKYPGGGYIVTGIGSGIENFYEVQAMVKAYDINPEFAKTYNYLFEKDEKRANEFLNDCKYELNSLRGQIQANEFLSQLKTDDPNALDIVANELGVTGEGLADGLNSFGHGVFYTFESLGTALGICEENRMTSVDEFKKMYILNALLSEEQKEASGLIVKNDKGEYVNANPTSMIDFTKNYEGLFLSRNYRISQGIGNMLPSMGIGMTLPPLGSVLLGISSGGNSYHNSMIEGKDYIKSLLYGAISGATESATEFFFGSIPGLSDVEVTSLLSWFKAAAKEGNEEVLQNGIDLINRRIIFGEQIELPKTKEEFFSTLKEQVNTWIDGAITSGILNSPRLVGALTTSNGKAITSSSSNLSDEEIEKKAENINKNFENLSLSFQKADENLNSSNNEISSRESTEVSKIDKNETMISEKFLSDFYESLNNKDDAQKMISIINSYTDETVPFGFSSVDDFKIELMRKFIASDSFLKLTDNNIVFLLCQDRTMINELVKTGKLNTLFINNITKLPFLLTEYLTYLTDDNLNFFLNQDDVIQFINELDGESLGTIISEFDKKAGISNNSCFLESEVLVNKIANMDIDNFVAFVKELTYFSGKYKLGNFLINTNNSQNKYAIRYLRTLSQKICSKNVLLKNIKYYFLIKNAIPQVISLDSFYSDDVRQEMDLIVSTYDEIGTIINDSILKSFDFDIGDDLLIPIQENDIKSCTMVYEIDGVEYTKKMGINSESCIDLTKIIDVENSDFIQAAIDGRLHIKRISSVYDLPANIQVKISSSDSFVTISTYDLLKIIVDDDIYSDYLAGFKDEKNVNIQNFRFAIGIEQILEEIDKMDSSSRNELIKKYGLTSEHLERMKFIKNNFACSPKAFEFLKWANSSMIDNFRREFGDYLSEEQFKKLLGTFKFLEEEAYRKVQPDLLVAGFNDGKVNVMNISRNSISVKSTVSHESIHQLSSYDSNYDSYTGVMNRRTGKYRGINECLTEYFNELCLDDFYPDDSGYKFGILRLKALLNLKIDGVNLEAFKKAYFVDHDLSTIRNAIDGISYDGFFEEKLIPAFDISIEGAFDTSFLDAAIAELSVYKMGGM